MQREMEISAMIDKHGDPTIEQEPETGGKRQKQQAMVAKSRVSSPKKYKLQHPKQPW